MDDSVLTTNKCFQFDVQSGSAICRIIANGFACKQKISNNHHGNKVRHLRIMHPAIFDKIKNNMNKKSRTCVDQFTVNLSINRLYAGFVELVSKNGRPFCITQDSGMRIIIDPILEGIYKSTGNRITVNSSVIKIKLHDAYEQVKNEIRSETKKKPIALMLDIATKHNRSILGVNVRYYTDKGFVIRTIGMELLKNSHTAQEIYTMLSRTLEDYGIDPIQIISYTTDNAGNVVNVCDWLNCETDEFLMDQGYELDADMFASLNQDYFGNLVTEIHTILVQKRITHIPCAAHTEQLSVKDALKYPSIANEISFAKKLVIELRTPTLVNILRERNRKLAVFDHEIRWNYTYLMVFSYFLKKQLYV